MIVVIGGGPAGRIGAMRLAQAGKEVRLIEKRKIGGQCLHDRCMTLCALNDVARLVEYARTQKDLGILDSVPAVSYPAVKRRMREIQEKLSTVLDAETRRAGVEIVYGAEGRLEGDRVYIDDEEVRADAVLAATGSRAAIPDIPGTDLFGVYTYQTLPAMEELPRRMIIIGGGVVAAEFAHVFRAFGSGVDIVARHGLLRGLDGKVRSAAMRDLAGVGIREETAVLGIEGDSRVRSVLLAGGDEIEADVVLLATGLLPRSESLQGLRKSPDGAVIVDRQMRTSVEGVYAAGDVIGPPYLTPPPAGRMGGGRREHPRPPCRHGLYGHPAGDEPPLRLRLRHGRRRRGMCHPLCPGSRRPRFVLGRCGRLGGTCAGPDRAGDRPACRGRGRRPGGVDPSLLPRLPDEARHHRQRL
ncbi:NAD(P)/FAD-dependent oxidoreductase [Methanoculleus sp. 10]|uniref:NAD(P)/FAD-dependent oxidoreductase n=1 Tax=Methanoculleus sp. 10 TaxID=430615 RepID=UPI0025EECAA4|nr:NAD(P)/FAD-dependent oxidoreductase [Methanoculleus sp. 10]